MSIKKINVGAVQNDGTGDQLRDAFVKVNENFEELESSVGSVSAANAAALLDRANHTGEQAITSVTGLQSALAEKANRNNPAFSGKVDITTGTVSQSIPEAVGAVDTLEVIAPSSAGAAFMSFHRPNAFAAHFGIDTDNKLKIGGWSWGATSHAIYHEGYKPKKTDVGLANVDNTSDANKPISNATQTALNGKANTSHTHAVADVSGLQAALDGKAASSHSHTIDDVTGLQAALEGTVKTTGNQTVSGEKTFTSVLRAGGGVFLPAQAGEKAIGWEFPDRGVYFFGRANDLVVGLYDPVGGLRFVTDKFGNFTAGGNVTAFSDIRLKTDLTKIAGALGKVCALNGYTYTRKDTGQRQTGVVAQELQEVLPEAVFDNGEHLAVAYGNIVGLLIEAIKELKAEVDQLKGK